MKLKKLIDITNNIFYADSNSWRVIQSKQAELLSFIHANTSIDSITPELINKYIEYLKQKNNKSATINSKLAYLKHILIYAYKNNWLDKKPYIPTLKNQNKEIKIITSTELEMMLSWCNINNYTELKRFLIIGRNTGIRADNILHIKPENIDSGYIRVWQNKTNTAYSIPINDKVREALTGFTGFTMNYQAMYYMFNKMKKQLQLDSAITPHSLRHTFCSELIKKGVSLPVVQALANHKRIETTMLYIHLNNEQLENAVNLL